ncbi:Fibrinogen- domains (FReDs) [Branchiostoma belcheri]|nr:Fibrinogen- domains (FReDs) [Branchiostoma belcheri]
MSSKKLFPNGEAAREGSVGRHENQRTLGIVLALSGLAAVVSVVTLLFVVRELTFLRAQQDQQGRDHDQLVLLRSQLQDLMQGKHELGVKTNAHLSPEGPTSLTKDWRRDNSATFWKSAEVHHRSKREAMANTVSDIRPEPPGGMDETVCRVLLVRPVRPVRLVHPETQGGTGRTDNKAHPVRRARPETQGGTGRTDNKAHPVRRARPETQGGTGRTDNKAHPVRRARPETKGGTGRTDNKARPVRRVLSDPLESVRQTLSLEVVTLFLEVVTPSLEVAPRRRDTAEDSYGGVQASDCADLYAAGATASGVYNITLNSSKVEVYCDMNTAVTERPEGKAGL